MTAIRNIASNHIGTLILLLFAGLSLVLVVQSRDAFSFMGWVFSFALVLVVGNGPQGAPSEEY